MFRPARASASALTAVVAQRLVRRLCPACREARPAHDYELRLLGLDTAQVQHDRFGALDALVQRYACTVVLKGAGTLVGAPGRRPCVIGAGNPGMATGGMGDLLTGTIAAMRAQGLPAFEAACAGALLHSLAGDAAAREGQRGLLPSDLLPWLRRLANPEA